MIRIIYASQAIKPFNKEELMALLRQSREANTKEGLTGVLLYQNGSFVQVLEGYEEKVNSTLQRIKKDKRHKNITVLDKTYITERQFGEWSMGFEELQNMDMEHLNITGLNHFFLQSEQNPSTELSQKLVGSLLAHFRELYENRQKHEELPVHDNQNKILLFSHHTIRMAVSVLALLMVLVIVLGVADVFYVLYQKMLAPPKYLLSIQDMLATFGSFLAVLIAVEIFLNISLYLRSDVIPVKLVVATALMAISRKVIVFDFKSLEPEYIYASGFVVLALGVTYWLIERNESLLQHSDH